MATFRQKAKAALYKIGTASGKTEKVLRKVAKKVKKDWDKGTAEDNARRARSKANRVALRKSVEATARKRKAAGLPPINNFR